MFSGRWCVLQTRIKNDRKSEKSQYFKVFVTFCTSIFSKISNFYAQWLVIYRPETKKAFWSVKLPFEGKIFKKMRFEELILKDISG